MHHLRERLRAAMTGQFHKELNVATNRIQDAIAPYTRFVRAEQEKTTTRRDRLAALQNVIEGLSTHR